jgi:hypothetical protein
MSSKTSKTIEYHKIFCVGASSVLTVLVKGKKRYVRVCVCVCVHL